MTNRIILNDRTTPIMIDANTRTDRTLADAILAMLETGTIHTPAANRLNRDDRRALATLRLAMTTD